MLENLNNLIHSGRNYLVAAEVDAAGMAELFFREPGSSQVTRESVSFAPFILLAHREVLDGFTGEFALHPLHGSAPVRYMAVFPDTAVYKEAVDFLKKEAKKSTAGAMMLFQDMTNQILNALELRFYRGMKFNDIRRMQFDIETVSPSHEFPSPEREEDEIVIISITDNHGFERVISQRDFSEKELLEEFVKTVIDRDPDVLEGHNICRFDLPYIEARAKRHKVKLNIGRDGKPAKKRSSFFTAAERTVNYTRYDIYGRMVVDTLHLAQFYDVINRSLESFNLKYLARHFGVAAENRTYVDGGSITSVWHDDPERLLAYALDDVKETRAIADILLPSYFFMAQLVPLKLQDCVIRGKATVIDHMLIAEYLKKGESLPLPEAPVQFAGALTISPRTGVFKEIYHCDVRSLYPSIIIADNLTPSRDTLGIYPKLLKELRLFRLEAKDAARANPAERDYYNALQSTFKILINSFYGYLGASQSIFNDYAMAERITAKGRMILQSMLDFLTENRCTVLEADTDGVYFLLPSPDDSPKEWQAKIQSILPPGINIELDAHYLAMFCYKSKNYALLTENGEIEISGAALKSRGLEPFQREFLNVILHSLLKEEYSGITERYQEFSRQISDGAMPTAMVAKTETLKDSVAVYKRKLASGSGRRAAAYELAAAHEEDYQPGDQISYYVTGEKKTVPVVDNCKLLADADDSNPDYNRAYYQKKLDELYGKFREFIPDPPSGDDLFNQNQPHGIQ